MATYKINHPTTGMVVNLYIASQTGAVPNGTRVSLYSWQNNNDQKWQMESVGTSKLLRLARDTSKVLNRDSSNNNAHVWTYDSSEETQQDSLIVTETVNGNTRIKLAYHGLYLTKNANDNFLSWTNETASNRQYFSLEEISEGTSYNTVWPLSDKTTYPITSGFRTASRPDHDGVDMAAPIETPIYAIYDGTVSKVTSEATNPSEGISVRIDHDFGTGKTYRYLRSYYLHMHSAVVTAGSSVNKGEVIGYVNNTGVSDGNHLHLGVRYKETAFTTGGNFYEGVDFIDPVIVLP